VCIHEATFDDELQVDAEAKNHSTTSEALSVAQAMGAKACVLTHFSQRYQKLPVLQHGNGNGEVEEECKDVGQELAQSSDVAEEHQGDEDIPNSEDAVNGPLEDVASTFPDQLPANGDEGQQYDIPSKRSGKAGQRDKARRFSSSSGPAAVKLKLASDMKVCVAFDYMRVKVGEMWQMEKFTPALLKLFAEEEKVKDEDASSGPAEQGKKGKKEKQKKEVKKEPVKEVEKETTDRPVGHHESDAVDRS
jgi:ribonuclease Z